MIENVFFIGIETNILNILLEKVLVCLNIAHVRPPNTLKRCFFWQKVLFFSSSILTKKNIFLLFQDFCSQKFVDLVKICVFTCNNSAKALIRGQFHVKGLRKKVNVKK